jgi:hypothetical protein
MMIFFIIVVSNAVHPYSSKQATVTLLRQQRDTLTTGCQSAIRKQPFMSEAEGVVQRR